MNVYEAGEESVTGNVLIRSSALNLSSLAQIGLMVVRISEVILFVSVISEI